MRVNRQAGLLPCVTHFIAKTQNELRSSMVHGARFAHHELERVTQLQCSRKRVQQLKKREKLSTACDHCSLLEPHHLSVFCTQLQLVSQFVFFM